ncbi:hypothetical protein FNF27_01622 [Cafeteria roenbergensis]|uniref:Uncharacterized protein n=1 Tax=Cafeteria roenbergensis TaxID=33653 RepID=A0A5A8ELK0_CAFRO|nr:hypothetical protein FNF27_01622 [Cafeteria roenbergensis]
MCCFALLAGAPWLSLVVLITTTLGTWAYLCSGSLAAPWIFLDFSGWHFAAINASAMGRWAAGAVISAAAALALRAALRVWLPSVIGQRRRRLKPWAVQAFDAQADALSKTITLLVVTPLLAAAFMSFSSSAPAEVLPPVEEPGMISQSLGWLLGWEFEAPEDHQWRLTSRGGAFQGSALAQAQVLAGLVGTPWAVVGLNRNRSVPASCSAVPVAAGPTSPPDGAASGVGPKMRVLCEKGPWKGIDPAAWLPALGRPVATDLSLDTSATRPGADPQLVPLRFIEDLASKVLRVKDRVWDRERLDGKSDDNDDDDERLKERPTMRMNVLAAIWRELDQRSRQELEMIVPCLWMQERQALQNRMLIATEKCSHQLEVQPFAADEDWSACVLKRLAASGPVPRPGVCEELAESYSWPQAVQRERVLTVGLRNFLAHKQWPGAIRLARDELWNLAQAAALAKHGPAGTAATALHAMADVWPIGGAESVDGATWMQPGSLDSLLSSPPDSSSSSASSSSYSSFGGGRGHSLNGGVSNSSFRLLQQIRRGAARSTDASLAEVEFPWDAFPGQTAAMDIVGIPDADKVTLWHAAGWSLALPGLAVFAEGLSQLWQAAQNPPLPAPGLFPPAPHQSTVVLALWTLAFSLRWPSWGIAALAVAALGALAWAARAGINVHRPMPWIVLAASGLCASYLADSIAGSVSGIAGLGCLLVARTWAAKAASLARAPPGTRVILQAVFLAGAGSLMFLPLGWMWAAASLAATAVAVSAHASTLRRHALEAIAEIRSQELHHAQAYDAAAAQASAVATPVSALLGALSVACVILELVHGDPFTLQWKLARVLPLTLLYVSVVTVSILATKGLACAPRSGIPSAAVVVLVIAASALLCAGTILAPLATMASVWAGPLVLLAVACGNAPVSMLIIAGGAFVAVGSISKCISAFLDRATSLKAALEAEETPAPSEGGAPDADKHRDPSSAADRAALRSARHASQRAWQLSVVSFPEAAQLATAHVLKWAETAVADSQAENRTAPLLGVDLRTAIEVVGAAFAASAISEWAARGGELLRRWLVVHAWAQLDAAGDLTGLCEWGATVCCGLVICAVFESVYRLLWHNLVPIIQLAVRQPVVDLEQPARLFAIRHQPAAVSTYRRTVAAIAVSLGLVKPRRQVSARRARSAGPAASTDAAAAGRVGDDGAGIGPPAAGVGPGVAHATSVARPAFDVIALAGEVAREWLVLLGENANTSSVVFPLTFLARFKSGAEEASLAGVRLEASLLSRRIAFGSIPLPSWLLRRSVVATLSARSLAAFRRAIMLEARVSFDAILTVLRAASTGIPFLEELLRERTELDRIQADESKQAALDAEARLIERADRSTVWQRLLTALQLRMLRIGRWYSESAGLGSWWLGLLDLAAVATRITRFFGPRNSSSDTGSDGRSRAERLKNQAERPSLLWLQETLRGASQESAWSTPSQRAEATKDTACASVAKFVSRKAGLHADPDVVLGRQLLADKSGELGRAWVQAARDRREGSGSEAPSLLGPTGDEYRATLERHLADAAQDARDDDDEATSKVWVSSGKRAARRRRDQQLARQASAEDTDWVFLPSATWADVEFAFERVFSLLVAVPKTDTKSLDAHVETADDDYGLYPPKPSSVFQWVRAHAARRGLPDFVCWLEASIARLVTALVAVITSVCVALLGPAGQAADLTVLPARALALWTQAVLSARKFVAQFPRMGHLAVSAEETRAADAADKRTRERLDILVAHGGARPNRAGVTTGTGAEVCVVIATPESEGSIAGTLGLGDGLNGAVRIPLVQYMAGSWSGQLGAWAASAQVDDHAIATGVHALDSGRRAAIAADALAVAEDGAECAALLEADGERTFQRLVTAHRTQVGLWEALRPGQQYPRYCELGPRVLEAAIEEDSRQRARQGVASDLRLVEERPEAAAGLLDSGRGVPAPAPEPGADADPSAGGDRPPPAAPLESASAAVSAARQAVDAPAPGSSEAGGGLAVRDGAGLDGFPDWESRARAAIAAAWSARRALGAHPRAFVPRSDFGAALVDEVVALHNDVNEWIDPKRAPEATLGILAWMRARELQPQAERTRLLTWAMDMVEYATRLLEPSAHELEHAAAGDRGRQWPALGVPGAVSQLVAEASQSSQLFVAFATLYAAESRRAQVSFDEETEDALRRAEAEEEFVQHTRTARLSASRAPSTPLGDLVPQCPLARQPIAEEPRVLEAAPAGLPEPQPPALWAQVAAWFRSFLSDEQAGAVDDTFALLAHVLLAHRGVNPQHDLSWTAGFDLVGWAAAHRTSLLLLGVPPVRAAGLSSPGPRAARGV